MPLYRTEAIVIGGWNLGEADRIIPFCTRRMGIVRGVARGARRVKSRFGGRLQLFTHGLLIGFARENRELHRINEFEPLDSFQVIRSDLDRMSRACYLVELASCLTGEGETSEDTYRLLLSSLRRLERGPDPFHAERAFEVDLLHITGYLPELERCMRCRRVPAGEEAVSFVPPEGGILCRECQTKSFVSAPLSAPSLSYLQKAWRGDYGSMLATRLSNAERNQMLLAIRAYIDYVAQRQLRSWGFMERLKEHSRSCLPFLGTVERVDPPEE